jgi:hypothetical protein
VVTGAGIDIARLRASRGAPRFEDARRPPLVAGRVQSGRRVLCGCSRCLANQCVLNLGSDRGAIDAFDHQSGLQRPDPALTTLRPITERRTPEAPHATLPASAVAAAGQSDESQTLLSWSHGAGLGRLAADDPVDCACVLVVQELRWGESQHLVEAVPMGARDGGAGGT